MIELKKCCKVPYPERLFEEYEEDGSAMYANVSASKVIDMMKCFIDMHNEPLFFILEIPETLENLEPGETSSVDDFYTDVYYIDGMEKEQAIRVLDTVGDILVKDGLNTFGIGAHISHDELLFGKYNLMTAFAPNTSKIKKLFSKFKIQKTKSFVSAWNTFDPEHPGESRRYTSPDGKSIFDIPEMLSAEGIYFAEKRAEHNSDNLTFDALLGKVLLVGIRYFTEDDEFISSEQFFGIVTEADEEKICIKQEDGSIRSIPPELRFIQRAEPGEYTLKSTKQVVKDPDFLITWNVTKQSK